MPLIDSPRLRPGDREAWERASAQDLDWSRTSEYRRRIEQAESVLVRFAGRGPCYAGVSWGKDSIVVAHMAARLAPHMWLVWIRVDHHNPDCQAVRDAFRAAYPDIRYLESPVSGPSRGRALLPDLGRGVPALGRRYLSGIRAEENQTRETFHRVHGDSTERFCAPIIRLRWQDVYAYMAEHDLPVHPAYAMSFGGALPRQHLRVSSLGGQRGRGTGRAEWERAYYGDVLARLNRGGDDAA